MIFKTFENDIDKWTAKIGIFGKSFNELGTAIKNALWTSKNEVNNFGEEISFWDALKNNLLPKKEDITSQLIDVMPEINTDNLVDATEKIKNLSKDVANGTTTWQELFDALPEGQKHFAQLGQQMEGQIITTEGVAKANKAARNTAIAHNEALKQQTLSAKAGQVALKGLAMVGNMFAGFLIAKGFELVAKEIDKYVNRIEKAKEASEKFLSSFESSQQTLASHKELIKTVEDEYLGLSNGVDALGRNISLSTEDFQKYQNICNQIAEAYPQMVSAWDKEGNAVINLKNKVNELKEAYEEERIASLNSFVAGADKVTKAYKSSTDTSASFSFEKTSGYKQQLEALKETYKLLNEYKDKEKLSFLDKEAIASEISGSVANGLPSRLKKKLVNGVLLSK